MILELSAPIKDYAWGSQGTISRFLGCNPSGGPEAEVWFGVHPLSNTRIRPEGDSLPLVSWLSKRGSDFPLLVKLLAAHSPLSIQVHPGAADAAEGFTREEAQGISLTDARRNYRDVSAKPELMVALTDQFLALSGFVTREVLEARLARWEGAGLDGATVELLRTQASRAPQEMVSWILEAGLSARECVTALSGWAQSVLDEGVDAETQTERQILDHIARAHPGDYGILFAVMMHHVSLEKGQALFVDAGEVHAYVNGFGLEVMLPSDNVVRAGLTTKHCDGEEFLRLAHLGQTDDPRLVSPSVDGGRTIYDDFPAPFRVTRLSAGEKILAGGGPSVLIVEEGVGVVEGLLHTVKAKPGLVAFVTADEASLQVTGDTVAWVVAPG